MSVRDGDTVRKRRRFMGTDLDPEELRTAESEADLELGVLEAQVNGKLRPMVEFIIGLL